MSSCTETAPRTRSGGVQAAVLFLEDLPAGRADSVCRRARAFGMTPQYARAVSELFLRHQEANRGWD